MFRSLCLCTLVAASVCASEYRYSAAGPKSKASSASTKKDAVLPLAFRVGMESLPTSWKQTVDRKATIGGVTTNSSSSGSGSIDQTFKIGVGLDWNWTTPKNNLTWRSGLELSTANPELGRGNTARVLMTTFETGIHWRISPMFALECGLPLSVGYVSSMSQTSTLATNAIKDDGGAFSYGLTVRPVVEFNPRWHVHATLGYSALTIMTDYWAKNAAGDQENYEKTYEGTGFVWGLGAGYRF